MKDLLIQIADLTGELIEFDIKTCDHDQLKKLYVAIGLLRLECNFMDGELYEKLAEISLESLND